MGANNAKQMSRLEKALGAMAGDDLENAIKNARVPEELVRKMHKSFTDACPDSKMTRDKFRTFYASFFAGSKPGCYTFFDHLFRTYDRDGSGTLDFTEFLQIFDVLYCGSPEEKLDLTFRVCDIDNSGTVEPNELQIIIAAMLEMSDISAEDKERLPTVLSKSIFSRLDSDGDGQLDKGEFIKGCMNEPLIFNIFSAAFSMEEMN